MGVEIYEKTNRIRCIWFKGYKKDYLRPYQIVKERDRRYLGLCGPIKHLPYKIKRGRAHSSRGRNLDNDRNP